MVHTVTDPVTGWRFSIDGERNAITTRMAEHARPPVPLRGEKYAFEGVEYRVLASEVNYNSNDSTLNTPNDSTSNEATSIADVHLETITAP